MAGRRQISNLQTLKAQAYQLKQQMRRQERELKTESYMLLGYVPVRVLEQTIAPFTGVPVAAKPVKNPIGKLMAGLAAGVFRKQGFLKRIGISIAAHKLGATLEKKILKKS